MTDVIKLLPKEFGSYSSIREYQNQCQKFADKLKKGPLDWEQAIATNRYMGDKKFQITYTDEAQDFYCAADFNWERRSLQIKGGLLSHVKKKHAKKKALEVLADIRSVPDSCKLTQELWGESEFKGKVCKDNRLDPRLADMDMYHSAKLFLQRCNELQPQFSILVAPEPVTADKVELLDDVRGDGIYTMRYSNADANFFCEAIVDSTQHGMMLRHGMLHEMDTVEPSEGMEITDACSMTQGLLGAEELVGSCTDKTKEERDWEFYITMGAYAGGSALALLSVNKLAKRLLTARSGLPVYKHLASAYFAAAAFDTFSGFFLPEDHPVRKSGTMAAGVAAFFFPKQFWRGIASVVPQSIRAGIATRIAARASGSFVGSMVGQGWKGFLRSGTRLAAGALAVPLVNYAWRRWVTGSDYQSSVNQRVASIVYDRDDVYEFEWSDLFPLKGGLKLIRGGARWVAPDMMNSGITSDNGSLEDKIKAEDKAASDEAAAFLAQVLPALLSQAGGRDPQITIALLRDDTIELTKLEKEISEYLFQEGPAAAAEKYVLNPQEVDDLAYKALLKKVQDAGAWMAFVPGNDWAKEVFHSNGTLKASYDDDAKEAAGEFPYMELQKRFPHVPELDEYWVDLVTGEKIPAFEPPPGPL